MFLLYGVDDRWVMQVLVVWRLSGNNLLYACKFSYRSMSIKMDWINLNLQGKSATNDATGQYELSENLASRIPTHHSKCIYVSKRALLGRRIGLGQQLGRLLRNSVTLIRQIDDSVTHHPAY